MIIHIKCFHWLGDHFVFLVKLNYLQTQSNNNDIFELLSSVYCYKEMKLSHLSHTYTHTHACTHMCEQIFTMHFQPLE